MKSLFEDLRTEEQRALAETVRRFVSAELRPYLTAYAVRCAGEHFVTLINKEHGSGAREANVSVVVPGSAGRAIAIFLTAPEGDAAAKTGVMLGGASINADGPWLGKWTTLVAGHASQYLVKVPAASAAIVRIQARYRKKKPKKRERY